MAFWERRGTKADAMRKSNLFLGNRVDKKQHNIQDTTAFGDSMQHRITKGVLNVVMFLVNAVPKK